MVALLAVELSVLDIVEARMTVLEIAMFPAPEPVVVYCT